MSSNQCPVCQKEAMDAVTRLVKRPHACQHCGAEVRMNIIATSVLSLLYFVLAVRTMIMSGLNGTGMLYVLLMTVAYVVVLLFIPLESKQAGGKS